MRHMDPGLRAPELGSWLMKPGKQHRTKRRGWQMVSILGLLIFCQGAAWGAATMPETPEEEEELQRYVEEFIEYKQRLADRRDVDQPAQETKPNPRLGRIEPIHSNVAKTDEGSWLWPLLGVILVAFAVVAYVRIRRATQIL